MITSMPATSRYQQRAALGLYLPFGYPSRTVSRDTLHLMAQHADILELGLPHSYPHLVGPVIQQACAQAIDRGFQMLDLFEAATELTASNTAALVVMSYGADRGVDHRRCQLPRFHPRRGGPGVRVQRRRRR